MNEPLRITSKILSREKFVEYITGPHFPQDEILGHEALLRETIEKQLDVLEKFARYIRTLEKGCNADNQPLGDLDIVCAFEGNSLKGRLLVRDFRDAAALCPTESEIVRAS